MPMLCVCQGRGGGQAGKLTALVSLAKLGPSRTNGKWRKEACFLLLGSLGELPRRLM